jgi:hypothetical protein
VENRREDPHLRATTFVRGDKQLVTDFAGLILPPARISFHKSPFLPPTSDAKHSPFRILVKPVRRGDKLLRVVG